ncbi:hypothetical protein EDB89DRAFT_1904387 [Lactarius sanguifluus]|nr:hypothetical protein EDB89DRAFT_1904387 [Lactarius sanguifluus]
MEDDHNIDEASPDEDERQAQQFLRSPGQPLGGTSDTRGNVAMRDRTASEDDNDSSDDNGAPAPRSTRTFRPIELAKPINLRFYSGIWCDVLITAKTYHRLAIHAESNLLFPEHNKDGLQNAHECILEAIGCLENGKLAKFNDPIYCTYKRDMILLVINNGSTHCGRMKDVAREVIKKCFSKELEPHLPFDHNSEQKRQVISEAVQAIIRGSQFLRRAELDKNQRTENFAHPVIIELCKQFYYSGKSDCLSVLFPYHFARLPTSALAMACTCISNCLSEWESGIQVQTSFTGRIYEAVYIAMWDLINETMRNDYHGRKLRVLLKQIAKEGQLHPTEVTGPEKIVSVLKETPEWQANWSRQVYEIIQAYDQEFEDLRKKEAARHKAHQKHVKQDQDTAKFTEESNLTEERICQEVLQRHRAAMGLGGTLTMQEALDDIMENIPVHHSTRLQNLK